MSVFLFIPDEIAECERFYWGELCMAQDPNEYYEGVLADLEAKRATIDTMIANLRQIMGLGASVAITGGVQGVVAGAKPIDPANIRDDAFFGLSIGEAGKRYLEMVKRKQSTQEIADALERGGLPHTSTNFTNTVGTMMNRLAKADPDIARVGRGEWGLAAWYGNRRPKPPEPPKKRRSKKRKKAEPDAESSSTD